MTVADGWLLLKKILLGVAITIVPLAVISAGLWGVQQIKSQQSQGKPTSAKVTYAN